METTLKGELFLLMMCVSLSIPTLLGSIKYTPQLCDGLIPPCSKKIWETPMNFLWYGNLYHNIHYNHIPTNLGIPPKISWKVLAWKISRESVTACGRLQILSWQARALAVIDDIIITTLPCCLANGYSRFRFPLKIVEMYEATTGIRPQFGVKNNHIICYLSWGNVYYKLLQFVIYLFKYGNFTSDTAISHG